MVRIVFLRRMGDWVQTLTSSATLKYAPRSRSREALETQQPNPEPNLQDFERSGYVSILVLLGFLWVGILMHSWSQLLVRMVWIEAEWRDSEALNWLGSSAVNEAVFHWHRGVVQASAPTRSQQLDSGSWVSEFFDISGYSGWQSLQQVREYVSPGGADWQVHWRISPRVGALWFEDECISFPWQQRYDWSDAVADWVDPEIAQKLRPVLAAAVLHIGVFHAQATGDIRLRYHIEGLLWNPYHQPLPVPEEAHLVAGLGVEFSGLPIMTLHNSTTGQDLFTVPLEDTLDFRWQSGPFRAWIHTAPRDPDSDVWMQAGEVRYFKEPLQQQGLVRLLPGGLGRIPVHPDVFDAGHELLVRITNTHSEKGVHARLLERDGAGHYGATVFEAQLPVWPIQEFLLDPENFWLERSEDYRIGNSLTSFGFSLGLDPKGLQFWRTEYDLRSGTVSAPLTELNLNERTFLEQLDFNKSLAIYHSPQWAEPKVHIAALRSLHWPNLPPHVLGEPHGQVLNRKLDSWQPKLFSNDAVQRWNVHNSDPAGWHGVVAQAHGWAKDETPEWLWLWAESLSGRLAEPDVAFAEVSDFLASGLVQVSLPEEAFPMTQGDLLEPLLGRLAVRGQFFVLDVKITEAEDTAEVLWQHKRLLEVPTILVPKSPTGLPSQRAPITE